MKYTGFICGNTPDNKKRAEAVDKIIDLTNGDHSIIHAALVEFMIDQHGDEEMKARQIKLANKLSSDVDGLERLGLFLNKRFDSTRLVFATSQSLYTNQLISTAAEAFGLAFSNKKGMIILRAGVTRASSLMMRALPDETEFDVDADDFQPQDIETDLLAPTLKVPRGDFEHIERILADNTMQLYNSYMTCEHGPIVVLFKEGRIIGGYLAEEVARPLVERFKKSLAEKPIVNDNEGS